MIRKKLKRVGQNLDPKDRVALQEKAKRAFFENFHGITATQRRHKCSHAAEKREQLLEEDRKREEIKKAAEEKKAKSEAEKKRKRLEKLKAAAEKKARKNKIKLEIEFKTTRRHGGNPFKRSTISTD